MSAFGGKADIMMKRLYVRYDQSAACSDKARVSIVALPPFFEWYCTLIGPARNGPLRSELHR
jgi:hypothetical protein